MNKHTWTLTGVAAALLLSSSALATEVRFTHNISGGSSADALNQIIADFEAANPDITIKQIVFDDDIYQDTGLITQLQSSEVPDIYFQWPGFPLKRDVEAGYAHICPMHWMANGKSRSLLQFGAMARAPWSMAPLTSSQHLSM